MRKIYKYLGVRYEWWGGGWEASYHGNTICHDVFGIVITNYLVIRKNLGLYDEVLDD